jgi:hypothetical protein
VSLPRLDLTDTLTMLVGLSALPARFDPVAYRRPT